MLASAPAATRPVPRKKIAPAAVAAHAGQPAALFFHGVEPDTADPRLQTNHHEVAAFRAILEGLKDFDVLPLSAIGPALVATVMAPGLADFLRVPLQVA